ncbi:MAG TPA: hypothetical protein VFU47_08605 [Armatimonadota bacterium]|nr:hypothetical protein [Armatimonadota bacterium]
MTKRTGTWRVLTVTLDQLESQLNALEEDEYEVFTIQAVGMPAPQSQVPRDQKTLQERTTFAVTARKARG